MADCRVGREEDAESGDMALPCSEDDMSAMSESISLPALPLLVLVRRPRLLIWRSTEGRAFDVREAGVTSPPPLVSGGASLKGSTRVTARCGESGESESSTRFDVRTHPWCRLIPPRRQPSSSTRREVVRRACCKTTASQHDLDDRHVTARLTERCEQQSPNRVRRRHSPRLRLAEWPQTRGRWPSERRNGVST